MYEHIESVNITILTVDDTLVALFYDVVNLQKPVKPALIRDAYKRLEAATNEVQAIIFNINELTLPTQHPTRQAVRQCEDMIKDIECPRHSNYCSLR